MIIGKNAGYNLTKVANIIALTWRDREAAFILIFVYAQMDVGSTIYHQNSFSAQ